MVQREETAPGTRWACEACGFAYAERAWAEKCQAWCEKHHSCNLGIVRHALQPKTR